MTSTPAIEVDARLDVITDVVVLQRQGKMSRRAATRAIADLMPALIADAAHLDDTTDPGGPVPDWLRRELDLLRTGA